MRLKPLVIAILIALAGCAQVQPKPVLVPVTKYVPVPAALTQPCPIAEPEDHTVAEAVKVARERKTALAVCNAQLEQIRELGKQADAAPATIR